MQVGPAKCTGLLGARPPHPCRLSQVDVVLVSPLTRAVETALLMFPTDTAPPVPVVAVEWCREAHGGHPCDQRRPISVIAKEFPQVDFSQVATDEDSWHKKDRRCSAGVACVQEKREITGQPAPSHAPPRRPTLQRDCARGCHPL